MCFVRSSISTHTPSFYSLILVCWCHARCHTDAFIAADRDGSERVRITSGFYESSAHKPHTLFSVHFAALHTFEMFSEGVRAKSCLPLLNWKVYNKMSVCCIYILFNVLCKFVLERLEL